MLTRRQNILNMIQGQKPAWTPCSLNFNQWYDHHQRFKILPEELQQTENYLQAMKVLGCDIFSRNLDGGVREEAGNTRIETSSEPGSTGQRHTTTIHTPHGNFTHIFQDQEDQSTGYAVTDPVQNWDTQAKAYRWSLENTRITWDRDAYLKTDQQVGDDGIVMVPVGRTPLKKLQTDFGLDGSCFFLMDHPQEADQLCQLYWQALWPVLKELAEDEKVHAACLMDNVDTPFFPPVMCEKYWTPYVAQAAELFESHGKLLFVHACGKLRGLKEQFNIAKVHGLEGMAHAPLGDFEPQDVFDMHDRFYFNGGFSAAEQVMKSADELEPFYESFFKGFEGFDRLIFASSCQTTVTTEWDRIKQAVDLCRQFSPVVSR